MLIKKNYESFVYSHFTDFLNSEFSNPVVEYIYTAIPGKTSGLIGAFNSTKESIDCYKFSIRVILPVHRNPILASVSDVHLLTAVSIFDGKKK